MIGIVIWASILLGLPLVVLLISEIKEKNNI